MSVEIAIPKLGVEMTSATIDEWKIDEGKWVDKGEPVVVLQTEKVSYEYESTDSGYLHILGETGKEYEIGERIAILYKHEKEYEQITKTPAGEQGKVVTEDPSQITLEHKEASEKKANPINSRKYSNRKIKASPLAKKIATDHGLDLSTIQGTGPSGAIIKRDVIAAINSVQTPELPKAAVVRKDETPDETAGNHSIEFPNKRVKETIPLKGMRKAIANNMVKSLQVAAQVTDINEIEVDRLVDFRDDLNFELSEELGYKISFNDLFIKAVSIILKELPIFNSSIINDEIILWENINIGVAVAVEGGLVVPVIKDVDKLSLSEIRQQFTTLIERARNGTLSSDDLSGGTFTISNIGSYGGYISSPIINLPQSAILGVGKITEKPVVRNGEIVIGKLLGYSFTFDHRLIDGEIAGRFLNEFKRIMNNPKLLLVK